MNSSVTIRLPGLAVPSAVEKTSGEPGSRPTAEAEVSDEALMVQICEGSREALSILFRRHARVVRSVAYRVLRDSSEADDMLQDIFLLVHSKCATFDPSRGQARFWILQMTYRRAISRRRYLNSRHFYTRVDLDDVGWELAAPASESLRLADSGDGILGREAWQKALETLSENQRETLRLFFAEGYTLEEIAVKLKQTRGNVKHHYFRGLDKLRKEIFAGKSRDDFPL